MKIDVVSIFGAYLDPLQLSLVGKAQEVGILNVAVHDLRDKTSDLHKSVDDTAYGGGPGMVMTAQPWGEMLDELLTPTSVLIIPTPSGQKFTQEIAEDLAGQEHLVFACGRYEGIDARVAEHYAKTNQVMDLSLGDYVLAGGEAAVLVMVEAVARLLPGVLGNSESAANDSFSQTPDGRLLEGPVFTKPAIWRDLEVPSVLTSGNHAQIAAWRKEQSLARTRQNRPELAP
jgi:tRNA (guanine37-N1)-methyltransferase